MSTHNESTEPDRDPSNTGNVVDRRSGIDRRALARDGDDGTNLERRRGVGRRLTDFVRSAEEGEMSREQQMFLHAIDTFKRVNGVNFPTWTDVLEVVRRLGYRKVTDSELRLGDKVEDWTESPEAGSGCDHGTDIDAPQRYRKTG
ncbi:MAG: hypothetical protein CMJ23_03170 [Phycisphaerae bacterium]|nr:hypothetical protein [Phycisphaerae bacterium]